MIPQIWIDDGWVFKVYMAWENEVEDFCNKPWTWLFFIDSKCVATLGYCESYMNVHRTYVIIPEMQILTHLVLFLSHHIWEFFIMKQMLVIFMVIFWIDSLFERIFQKHNNKIILLLVVNCCTSCRKILGSLF